jgi:uncharacterized protein YcnI
VGLVAGLAVLAPAGSVVLAEGAAAHVRVVPDTTAPGEFAQLTIRVPNEADSGRTVKVLVRLPQRSPLPLVSVRPLPGWTFAVTRGSLPRPVDVEGTTVTTAPRTITWTARAGGGIGPGQYQDFSIVAGPLPAAGKLAFPTSQFGADGSREDWVQVTLPGGAEPERPAPFFFVGEPAGGSTRSVATGAAVLTTTPPRGDLTARLLGGGGLVLGVIAVALAWRRPVRPRPAPVRGAGDALDGQPAQGRRRRAAAD